eukprot:6193131-Pleurochrysis_carterae.AAC.1
MRERCGGAFESPKARAERTPGAARRGGSALGFPCVKVERDSPSSSLFGKGRAKHASFFSSERAQYATSGFAFRFSFSSCLPSAWAGLAPLSGGRHAFQGAVLCVCVPALSHRSPIAIPPRSPITPRAGCNFLPACLPAYPSARYPISYNPPYLQLIQSCAPTSLQFSFRLHSRLASMHACCSPYRSSFLCLAPCNELCSTLHPFLLLAVFLSLSFLFLLRSPFPSTTSLPSWASLEPSILDPSCFKRTCPFLAASSLALAAGVHLRSLRQDFLSFRLQSCATLASSCRSPSPSRVPSSVRARPATASWERSPTHALASGAA